MSTLADVLAAHTPFYSHERDEFWCQTCLRAFGDYRQFSVHQAEAVAAAGLAVIQLPDPQANWDGSLTTWPVPQTWHGEPDRPGEVNIRVSDGRIAVNSVSIPCDSPTAARSLAAALLAAADAAEQVTS